MSLTDIKIVKQAENKNKRSLLHPDHTLCLNKAAMASFLFSSHYLAPCAVLPSLHSPYPPSLHQKIKSSHLDSALWKETAVIVPNPSGVFNVSNRHNSLPSCNNLQARSFRPNIFQAFSSSYSFFDPSKYIASTSLQRVVEEFFWKVQINVTTVFFCLVLLW